MNESENISARRLTQLETTARARLGTGEATALEEAIPGLVAGLVSAGERSSRAEQEAARWRNRVHEDAHAIGKLQRENETLRAALAEVVMDLHGRSLPVPEKTRKRCEAALGRTFDIATGDWRPIQAALTGSSQEQSPVVGPPEHIPRERRTEPVLHLYPLADEHGDALISGNPEGLRILKDRLEHALSATERGGYYRDYGYINGPDEHLFPADGEAYHLSVECRPGGPHHPSWEEQPEPYYVPRRHAREAGMDV